MKYALERGFENVQKLTFPVTGQFDSPMVYRQKDAFQPCDFIGFNYAATEKEPETKGLHFFLDDYQFLRVWNSPERYVSRLQKFKYVTTPDFSLFSDYPKALQIYNHYRKQFIGAFLQSKGCNVIPTVGWSDRNSYDWCFDGIERGSIIAVSSVGTQNSYKGEFAEGYNAMIERLQPETVLFFGIVPDGLPGNIVKVKAFQDKFAERRGANGR